MPDMRKAHRMIAAAQAGVGRLGWIAVLIMVYASVSFGNPFVVFQPPDFIRSPGEPVAVTVGVTVLRPDIPYTLRIHNGGLEDKLERVSSAVVRVNGREVVRPSDFHQTVALIEKPLTLLPLNIISVELRSQPGSGLTLQIIGTDNDQPTITATADPPPNATGWNQTPVTIRFNCADTTSGIATCPPPITVVTEGANQGVSGTATDHAGNSSTASATVNLDTTPPSVDITSPADGSTLHTPETTVIGTVSDTLSGIDSVTCNGKAASVSGSTFACVLSLSEGANAIVARATDLAGNASTASSTVTFVLIPPEVTVPNVVGLSQTAAQTALSTANLTVGAVTTAHSPTVPMGNVISQSPGAGTMAPPGSVVDLVVSLGPTDIIPPVVTITTPGEGSIVNNGPITVTGTLDDPTATLTVNDVTVVHSDGTFTAQIALVEGPNTIRAIATDAAGNIGTAQVTVTLRTLPVITITAPANLSYFNISPTTITGTVDNPAAVVTVNAITAAVVSGNFSVALPLAEGPNLITATASTPDGAVGVHSIQVTLDTTPPRVTITSPPDQFVTTDSTITVTGIVNDIVVGTVNDQQAQVTVNGTAALVANRTFLATDVPLVLGSNVIQAVGKDRVGNAATTQMTVTRQALSQHAQLQLVSGNNQAGVIGSVLPEPLVVALTDATGQPVANQPVIFKVTQNDGALSAGGPPIPSVIATTNAQGQAQVEWTLGARAGAGANAVEVYAVGFGRTALFTATGTPGPPGKIVVDSGNDQIGAVNQPLPRPLIAVVVDNGNNRLAGVPVTFTLTQGGGSVAGQSSPSSAPIAFTISQNGNSVAGQLSVTVNTDTDGRAAVTWTLGSLAGNANNRAEVDFPSNPGHPVSFIASGRVPGDPAQTTISGVVLDNSNVPIPGVTIRAVLTNVLNSNVSALQVVAAVQTDAQGQFSIPQAPVGFVKLVVDGSTAQLPGQYPSLDYDLVTVPGQNNTVGMPIYLLPLKTSNQLCVTATTGGGTLTIPEAPGFSLTFGPGQVTFPGGSKTGCVSVTVVHGDKVPMVPGFGQQPRFIVTIQPAGAGFNPPAPITLPNVDGLKPREVTEMYSFDHDIGSFVAIGTGVVSDDGQVIRSSAGVGVLKAGWHCGGNPNTFGTCASFCKTPTASSLVTQRAVDQNTNGCECPPSSAPAGSVFGEGFACRQARPAYCEAKFGSACQVACGSICDPIEKETEFQACVNLCTLTKSQCLSPSYSCPSIFK